MNKLMIMEDPSKTDSYIALYTGETGMGESVIEEEAHNIEGSNKNEVLFKAAAVWGVDLDDCAVEFDYETS